ncbi:hypothetical protein LCGC14_2857080, partial [marine sediment metagenome]
MARLEPEQLLLLRLELVVRDDPLDLEVRQLRELGSVVSRSSALERERLLQSVGCSSHLCDDE